MAQREKVSFVAGMWHFLRAVPEAGWAFETLCGQALRADAINTNAGEVDGAWCGSCWQIRIQPALLPDRMFPSDIARILDDMGLVLVDSRVADAAIRASETVGDESRQAAAIESLSAAIAGARDPLYRP